MFCAALAPLSALWLLQLAEVDHSNDAVPTGGASEAAHLDQCSMGSGGVYDCAVCEVDATYTTPEAHALGSFRSTIAWQARATPRLTPPASSTNRRMHKRYLLPSRLAGGMESPFDCGLPASVAAASVAAALTASALAADTEPAAAEPAASLASTSLSATALSPAGEQAGGGQPTRRVPAAVAAVAPDQRPHATHPPPPPAQ